MLESRAPRPILPDPVRAVVLFELTYRCPLHCVFCYNPRISRYGYRAFHDDWLRVLREAPRLAQCSWTFRRRATGPRRSGNHRREAHSLGFYTNLITSGVGSMSRASRCSRRRLDHIQLSFQDSTREMNDFLSTRTFELKSKVAALIKKHDYPMVLMSCSTGSISTTSSRY